MGRKLEFCKDQALKTAMQSFWERGYAATSMRDLAERLDIHLGSVYHTLGDKEKIFEESLKLYLSEFVRPRLDGLTAAKDPASALEEFFERLARDCAGETPSPGCFLINSLINAPDVSPKIRQIVSGHLIYMEDVFTHVLERAEKEKKLSLRQSARQVARFLVTVAFSFYTMKKMGATTELILDTKDVALTSFLAIK